MRVHWAENGIVLTAIVAVGTLLVSGTEIFLARRPPAPIVVTLDAQADADDDAEARSAAASAVPLYGSIGELTDAARKLIAEPQPNADVLHELTRQARLLRAYELADGLLARELEVAPERVDSLFLRARTQSDLGHADQAIEMYRQVLAAAPNHQKATYNLGVQMRRAGDYGQADRYLARAAEVSSGRIKARALYQRGLAQGAAGHWDLAAQSFKDSASLRPGMARTWLDLGKAEEERGHLDEAQSAYEKSVALNPRFADGHLAMGLLAERRGNAASAASHLARAVKIDGDNTEYRKALARHQLATGDASHARTTLAWLVRRADNEADKAYATAMLALLDRDTERMLAGVKRADELRPGAYDDAIEQAAVVLHDHKRFADARALLGLLLARPNPSAELLLVSARTAAQLGELKEAESLLRRSLKARPGNSEAWFQLGRVLSAGGDTKGAIDAYRASLARNPDARNTRLNLAVLEARNGNEREALLLYGQILAKHPRYAPALLNRARLHERAGRTAEAVTDLTAAMAAAPTDTGMRDRLAQLLLKLGQTDRARALLADAVAESPANPEVRLLLAETDLKAGRRDDALRELHRAAALAGNDALLWRRLAKAYRDAGDAKAAAEAKARSELRSEAAQKKE